MGVWVKGQSGNPGGRPKILDEVQKLAREQTVANIKALVRVRDSKKSPPAAVVAAVSVIFDRAFGKPRQEHDIQHHIATAIATDADLLAIARGSSVGAAEAEAGEGELGGVVH